MKMSGEHLRDGDQLELDLFHGIPWDGRQPRALTRGHNLVFLRPEPHRHEVFFAEDQLELWPVEVPHR